MNAFFESLPISIPFILKLLKFGLVGISGLGVDFGITYLFKEKAKVNKYLANSLGFTAAVTNNYILNRIWTFKSDNPEILIQYVQFIAVALIGLAINNFFLYIFNQKILIRFYLAKLFAIGVATIWNFLINYYYTFGMST